MKSVVFNSASALAVALVLTTSAAQAQDAAAPQDDNVGLQDIVVTAQKRSECAQQVPIAISAVIADALQSKGLTDIASISGQAPNVTLKSPISRHGLGRRLRHSARHPGSPAGAGRGHGGL